MSNKFDHDYGKFDQYGYGKFDRHGYDKFDWYGYGKLIEKFNWLID